MKTKYTIKFEIETYAKFSLGRMKLIAKEIRDNFNKDNVDSVLQEKMVVISVYKDKLIGE